jgi:mycothiol synthase
MLVQTREFRDRNKELTFRPPTMDDLAAIVDLLNTCAIDQTGLPDTTRNLILSDWTGPAFDPSASVRIVETTDGQVVGYIAVWDNDPIPVSNWVWARVHPDFEGLGIGTELMMWAEERLQQTLARVPKDLRIVYHSGSLKTHTPTRKLLEDLGMELNRYFWRMVIDLKEKPPEPVWSNGIRMKSLVEVNDLRTVYRAFNDAFQDHWGHVEQPEEERLAEWKHWISSDEEFNPSLWLLAMDGEEIAGLCLCRRRDYEDPDMGWVSVLGVRRRWRRQGVGLAMLHFAFDKFRRMGKLRAGLGVDANSLTGATRLYEKAGMHVAREIYSYEKELRPGRDISKQSL